MHVTEGPNKEEIGIVVGVALPGTSAVESSEHLNELKMLAMTAGIKTVGQVTQERDKLQSAYYIGTGKVEEIELLIAQENATVIIFDDDLSPAQTKNLEKKLKQKIIDRSTLILDIFAKHARTREAKTQVELAQLQYMLPRLTRQWTHLSRQVGGIGTRGPGETQLETDRRLIRTRIEKLKENLRQYDRQRETRNKGRKNYYRASLIGYTNVGKSTIMNLLSGSDLLAENKLFATLDSTNRRIELNEDHDILMSDTVGFIRKLPHHLVASFKSTLKEVIEADLLLHVVDVSHDFFRDQMLTVMEVLQDLKSHKKPILIIFNKIDLLEKKAVIGVLKKEHPGAVFVSAQQGIGVEGLKKKLIEFVEESFVTETLNIPASEQKLLHTIHENAVVEEQIYDEMDVQIRFRAEKEVHRIIMDKLRTARIGN